jgi:hypothetical protein
VSRKFTFFFGHLNAIMDLNHPPRSPFEERALDEGKDGDELKVE